MPDQHNARTRAVYRAVNGGRFQHASKHFCQQTQADCPNAKLRPTQRKHSVEEEDAQFCPETVLYSRRGFLDIGISVAFACRTDTFHLADTLITLRE